LFFSAAFLLAFAAEVQFSVAYSNCQRNTISTD